MCIAIKEKKQREKKEKKEKRKEIKVGNKMASKQKNQLEKKQVLIPMLGMAVHPFT